MSFILAYVPYSPWAQSTHTPTSCTNYDITYFIIIQSPNNVKLESFVGLASYTFFGIPVENTDSASAHILSLIISSIYTVAAVVSSLFFRYSILTLEENYKKENHHMAQQAKHHWLIIIHMNMNNETVEKKMVLIHVIYHRANVSDVIFTMRVGFSISFHSSKTGVAFHPGRSICCHFSYCHRQNSIFISKHSCQAMAAMNPIYSYFDINFQSNEGV